MREIRAEDVVGEHAQDALHRGDARGGCCAPSRFGLEGEPGAEERLEEGEDERGGEFEWGGECEGEFEDCEEGVQLGEERCCW